MCNSKMNDFFLQSILEFVLSTTISTLNGVDARDP